MKLQLGPDFALPMKAVTEKLGFLGRTGSGKSYAAQKLAEQMHQAGAQFIVLDPVGVWYGLRLAVDGKKPGLPIPVLGGLRGDIPLEPTAGALIANLVVDRGTSVVLDVSQFESDADKARFAQAFADRFFFRKKASPSAVHLFIEEAQEFVPQNPQRDDARMLHAFTRLVKIGRNFGIGVSLISQRPQEVNKKVLNLTELLFAFQLTGPQERKTIQGWIAEKGIDEDIAGELPKLKVGHPHVWSPAWLAISKVVAIGAKTTFDASSTPEVGKAAAARELSPIDMELLRKEMAATIEKAKAEDPKLLRAEVARLRVELAQWQSKHVKYSVTSAPPKRVEIPVLKDAQIKRLEYLVGRIEAIDKVFGTWRAAFDARAQEVREAAASISTVIRVKLAPPPPPRAVPQPGHASQYAVGGEPRPPVFHPTSTSIARARIVQRGGTLALPKGEAKVLTAIAQHDAGVTREQLTVLTGYRRSTRDTYVQRLRERNLVDVAGEQLVATPAGIASLGDSFEPLPTGTDLRAHWLRELPEGERRILEILIDAYPRAVEREQLSAKTGYARSSRDTYLQRLSARKLITTTRGDVRASEELF